MGERSLSARIQNKCDTTANWAKATNFVPKKGEIIVYSDGGGTGIPKMKIGDGATKVGSLKFITVDPNASLSINGKSYNGSTAVDVGVIGAAYGGSGKTSLSASANVFLNSLPYGSTAETTLTDDHNFYMNSLTEQTNYKVPMSSVYTYVKGKLDSVYQPVGSYLTAVPKATTSILGGIKLGTGLTAAADGTVNVSVSGATITLKTWTDADVA